MSTRRLRWLTPAVLAFWVMACAPGGSPSPSAAARATPATTSAPTSSPTAATDRLRLETVASGFSAPVDLVAPDDGSGRLFVVEQTGTVQTLVDGVRSPAPFLDITDRILSGGERGLLGVALHPGYPKDPRVFVDYTDLDGNTVVSSFEPSLDGDVLDPGSEKILLQVQQPYENHNGGALAFGADGMLYIALGDGGSAGDPEGNGQRLDTLLGKILRIDVDVPDGSTEAYKIPEDNPFADGPDGARPEIWLYGMRNPWRMRFDPATSNLWIGDVGQSAWEEIDVVHPSDGGANLGWNTMEGSHCYQPSDGCDQTGLMLPVSEYGHGLGCAVVGGVVVHDATVPSIDGRYLFTDECSGTMWTIDPDAPFPQVPTEVLSTGTKPERDRRRSGRSRLRCRRRPRRHPACRRGRQLGHRRHAMRKVTVTVTEISVVPAWTGVPASDAIAILWSFPLGYGVATSPPSMMSLTPAIATPAAAARASARVRAAATAAARAAPSASTGSSRRNDNPSMLVAPAARAPSTTSPRRPRSRTVASTTFERS